MKYRIFVMASGATLRRISAHCIERVTRLSGYPEFVSVVEFTCRYTKRKTRLHRVTCVYGHDCADPTFRIVLYRPMACVSVPMQPNECQPGRPHRATHNEFVVHVLQEWYLLFELDIPI